MKVNLGREENNMCGCPVEASKPSEKEKTIHYPSFYIGNQYGPEDEDPIDLGELKGGQELSATVRVKSITRNEKADGKVRYSYDFEVVSVDSPNGSNSSDSNEPDEEEVIDKGIDEAMAKKEKKA